MTVTPGLAFTNIAATLAYLGLAVLGWGTGWSPSGPVTRDAYRARTWRLIPRPY
jgi:hypothetical protein